MFQEEILNVGNVIFKIVHTMLHGYIMIVFNNLITWFHRNLPLSALKMNVHMTGIRFA